MQLKYEYTRINFIITKLTCDKVFNVTKKKRKTLVYQYHEQTSS